METRLQVRKKGSQSLELLGLNEIKMFVRAGSLTPDDEVMDSQGGWLPLVQQPHLLGLEEMLDDAIELYEQGWRRTAIEQFQRLLAFDASIVEACLYLALGYSRLGALRQAEPFYQRCLQRGYKPGIAYNNLGVIAVYLRRSPSEAIEYLRKAIGNAPFQQAAPHYNLEAIYRYLHHTGKKPLRGESEEGVFSLSYLELARIERQKAQELEHLYAFLQDRNAELLFYEDIPQGFGAEPVFPTPEEQEKESIKRELRDARVSLEKGLLDEASSKLELLLARAEASEDAELKAQIEAALQTVKSEKRDRWLEKLDQFRRAGDYDEAIKIAQKIGQLDPAYAKQAMALERALHHLKA